MPSPPPVSPELLCESCGYAIADIDPDSSCPECGVSIFSSLPAARTGLWFQNYPRGWRTTVSDIVQSPRRSFRRMRIDRDRARSFLIRSLGVNALLWSAGLAVTTLLRESGDVYFLFFCIIAPLTLPFVAFGIFALTFVLTLGESFTVQLATRRRGWRITRDIAWNVCAYASCGWILGGVLYVLTVLAMFLWNAAIHAGELYRFSTQPFWIPVAIAAVPGLLAFETLVYLGIRQCRYANAPAPPAERDSSSL